ncbi:hypothetical protein [Neisseria bergeri]|uniref:hypothetical protein n=1 Tax=Neisseria bergeri TaxID=1906581 RepID=UPI00272AB56A|nr:hypothetical protein [Neisseria bergeri]
MKNYPTPRTKQVLTQIWDYAVRRGIITDERRNHAAPCRTKAKPRKNKKPPKKISDGILPSDKRRQPPKTKGNTTNIIEQEMKRAGLREIDAEIAKIIADAHKINAESVKIAQESRWYPMMAATGLVTAIAAVLALIFKFA